MGFLNWIFKKNTHPFSIELEVEDEIVLATIDSLIHLFRLNVTYKKLVRDPLLRLEISYSSPRLVHHLFLRRLLTLQGVGTINAI